MQTETKTSIGIGRLCRDTTYLCFLCKDNEWREQKQMGNEHFRAKPNLSGLCRSKERCLNMKSYILIMPSRILISMETGTPKFKHRLDKEAHNLLSPNILRIKFV